MAWGQGCHPHSQLEKLSLRGEGDSLQVTQLVSGRAELWAQGCWLHPQSSLFLGASCPQEDQSPVWAQCQPHCLPIYGDKGDWMSARESLSVQGRQPRPNQGAWGFHPADVEVKTGSEIDHGWGGAACSLFSVISIGIQKKR